MARGRSCPASRERDTPLDRWTKTLLARAHKNKVIVALANKLARIAWAILARGGQYEAAHVVAL
jgi:transposase